MSMLARAPGPRLRPFIKTLWATSEQRCRPGQRERVLPTGSIHLVLRLTGPPVRIFRGLDDLCGTPVGLSLIGGTREAFYLREVSQPATSVGVQLLPGTAELLLGVPGNLLSGRHTLLEDVWSDSAVAELRERLLAARSPKKQLALLEQVLARRLPEAEHVHPVVMHAIEHFAQHHDVASVVQAVGYSHRHFIALFTRAVGLSPKRYCRVLRFQRAIQQLARSERPLVELGLNAGYSDQSHLTREFQRFTGMAPGYYRQLRIQLPNHVPVL